MGGLVSQGYYTDISRVGVSNVSFNYDAGKIFKGLKSSTYFGFNISNMVRVGKNNDYLAYTSSISSKTGNDTIMKSSTHGLVTQSDNARLMDYYYQRYTFYENLSYDRTFGESTVQSTLTYNQVKAFFNGIEEPQRSNNVVWSASYSLKDKYSLQAVANYAGSGSFDKDLRYKLFPAVGASWVISDENFMSNMKLFDYLKLRTQYGITGNETYLPPFYYRDRWSQNNSGSAFGPYISLQWFGGTQEPSIYRNSPQRIGNPDLSWKLRKEFTIGFDVLLLNQRLSLDMTYWNITREGAIGQLFNSLPLTSGLAGARPYLNLTYTRTNALTLDIKFSEHSGDFSYSIGANASTATGSTNTYVQAGECTYNRAKLLQDRKIFLKYSFVSKNKTYNCTDTLIFRNRIRDGVNEWQDENPSHYTK